MDSTLADPNHHTTILPNGIIQIGHYKHKVIDYIVFSEEKKVLCRQISEDNRNNILGKQTDQA